MKKYSKNKLRFKRLGVFIGILLVLVLIFGIVLLTCFCFRKNIEKVKEDTSASRVSDDVAMNSSPLIVDNLVVGALYNSRWVSTSKYYLKSNLKSKVEIDVYNNKNKAGTYDIEDVYTINDAVYANTNYINYIDEYFAIPKGDNYALNSQFAEVEVLENDSKYVKKALGMLRVYNDSVQVKKVYLGYIDSNTPVRIIVASSSKKGMFDGIYTTLVAYYPNSNKAKIIDYDYTSNLEDTDDFELHSLEFIADLNGDGKAELITRDVTEFNVYYNVFEYKKGDFVRVLREKMKTK